MEDLESLRQTLARLKARNEEISRLKTAPRFKVVINETVKEYLELEKEEKENLENIERITAMLEKAGK